MRRIQEQEDLLFRIKENGDLIDLGLYTPTESLLGLYIYIYIYNM
jgi:hypothetical protein